MTQPKRDVGKILLKIYHRCMGRMYKGKAKEMVERDLFVRVNKYPSMCAALIYETSEAYVITRSDIGKSGKSLNELIKARFGNVAEVVEDMSMRVFYVIVRFKESQ